MVTYANGLAAGDAYEGIRVTVTPELNQQYLFAQEDFDLRYLEPCGSRPPWVHPALLLGISANTRSPTYRPAPGTGSVLAEDRAEFLAPAYVGSTFAISWRVRDVYEKRNRPYQAIEARVVDDAGTLILRRDLRVAFVSRDRCR